MPNRQNTSRKEEETTSSDEAGETVTYRERASEFTETTSSDVTGETVTYGERASEFTFSLVLDRNLLSCFV